MSQKSIFWEQRFENFNRALSKLAEAIECSKTLRETEILTSSLLKDATIRRFNLTVIAAEHVMLQQFDFWFDNKKAFVEWLEMSGCMNDFASKSFLPEPVDELVDRIKGPYLK